MDFIEENRLVCTAIHNYIFDQLCSVGVGGIILCEHIIDYFYLFKISAYRRTTGFGDMEEKDEPTRVHRRKGVIG